MTDKYRKAKIRVIAKEIRELLKKNEIVWIEKKFTTVGTPENQRS